MARKKQTAVKSGSKDLKEPARCLPIAQEGIKTGSEFAALMSALITDLVTGSVPPQIGNAVCNAGGKLLKIVELQLKYGKPADVQHDGSPPALRLVS